MSIAEKLTAIAENLTRVFNKGKEKGVYDWWDEYQSYRANSVKEERSNWRYAFAGYGWTDASYNPIRQINIDSASDDMYANSWVTDTKVTIKLSNLSGNKTFRNSDIFTIPKLIVDESCSMSQQFTNCGSLENLTIDGTIGTDANFQWCEVLTVDSMISIIKALKDFTMFDPDNVYSCTIQFYEDCWANIEGVTDPESGKLWTEIVSDKGWNY